MTYPGASCSELLPAYFFQELLTANLLVCGLAKAQPADGSKRKKNGGVGGGGGVGAGRQGRKGKMEEVKARSLRKLETLI